MRNHSRENSPANGNNHISQRYFPRLKQLHVFGQSLPFVSTLLFLVGYPPAFLLLGLFTGCFVTIEFSWI